MWPVWGEEKYRVLVGKPQGKRLLVRCVYRLGDKTNVGLGGVGWEGSSR
jgi:hypothetical protein